MITALTASLSACGSSGDSTGTAENTPVSTETGDDSASEEDTDAESAPYEEEVIEDEDLSVYLDSTVNLSLDGIEDDIWSGEIPVPGGGSLEIQLPIMITGSGERLLGDSFRKIICVRKEDDGSLVPCKVEDNDNKALLSYAAFILERDTVALDNWKDDAENTDLSEEVKGELDKLPLSALTLNLIGDKDDYHLFKFSGGNKVDYGEVYSSISDTFREMDEKEYALIIE